MFLDPTACCSLCVLSQVNNDTPIADLRELIAFKRKQADQQVWYRKTTRIEGGQRAMIVICSPGEDRLAANLETLGFTVARTFKRRTGYPAGLLRMYMLDW